MPIYSYRCSDCENVFDKMLKIADMKQPEAEPCPSCGTVHTITQYINGAPQLGDPTRLGDTKKLPSGYKDVLRKIHDKVPKSNLNLKI